MKTDYILPLLILTISLTACQETVDPEEEKQAIKDVINGETQAYIDYDFEKVASYYIHDSLNFRLTTGADDHVFLEGWKEVSAFLQEQLEEGIAPEETSHIEARKEDFRIKLFENTAYVVCTEYWTYHTPGEPLEIKSRQVRFMEKVEGEWKIAFLSFVGISGYEEEEIPVWEGLD